MPFTAVSITIFVLFSTDGSAAGAAAAPAPAIDDDDDDDDDGRGAPLRMKRVRSKPWMKSAMTSSLLTAGPALPRRLVLPLPLLPPVVMEAMAAAAVPTVAARPPAALLRPAWAAAAAAGAEAAALEARDGRPNTPATDESSRQQKE